MYCIVTVVRFVIILIKFYVCMYICHIRAITRYVHSLQLYTGRHSFDRQCDIFRLHVFTKTACIIRCLHSNKKLDQVDADKPARRI